MVYTIEPGIYVPNVAGVRIEDDILVTKNGVEILTKFPKELQYILNKNSVALYEHIIEIVFVMPAL